MFEVYSAMLTYSPTIFFVSPRYADTCVVMQACYRGGVRMLSWLRAHIRICVRADHNLQFENILFEFSLVDSDTCEALCTVLFEDA